MLTAKEANSIAKVNGAENVETYNELNSVMEEISKAAKNGQLNVLFYGNEESMPISKYTMQKLGNLGYKLTEQTYDLDDCPGCDEVLKVSW